MTDPMEKIERDTLAKLKPFQRRTVEWAFSRLYPPDGKCASGRFLIADEVGLGKTMIAKGIMVKALRHLERSVERIDIVYICSNRDIARQNLDRLRVEGLEAEFTPHDRLTLLPLVENWHEDGRKSAFRKRGVNMISLTPGTSLELDEGTGLARERALILLLLRTACPDISETRLRNMLHSPSSVEGFKRELDTLRQWYLIDTSMERAFVRELKRNNPLYKGVYELSESFSRQRTNVDGTTEPYLSARKLIGQLRQTLARVCIDALQPDLVILDEFQRFSHLLEVDEQGRSDEAQLAQRLFEYADAHSAVRILLLSATPYQMFSVSGERTGEQHYAEFGKTCSFLFGEDVAAREALQLDLKAFNRLLYSLHDDTAKRVPELLDVKRSLEARLMEVMTRTDRVRATDRRDAMISTVEHPAVLPNADDIVAYVALKRLSKLLGQADLIEYWRSAPFPLSFLSGYGLHGELKEATARGTPEFGRLLRTKGVCLPERRGKSGDVSDLPNARSRHLVSEMISAGMDRLLWIPPALPCYAPGGPYADLGDSAKTKRLLFSSWRMVPRAVSVLASEAFSRRAKRQYQARYGRPPGALDGLLKFSETGGGAFALRYPSWTLAREFHPATIAMHLSDSGEIPSWSAMVRRCAELLQPYLRRLAEHQDTTNTRSDERWYWYAPLLIDGMTSGETWAEWFKGPAWTGIEGKEISEIVIRLQNDVADGGRLGRMPDDLASVLAALAIAGPGTCTLRSFGQTFGDGSQVVGSQASAAARVASHFQGYFNTQESAILVRGVAADQTGDYWRQVLWYCGEGCLQSVIDEYVHVLQHDGPHLSDDKNDRFKTAWDGIAGRFSAVLGLNAAVLVPDSLRSDESGIALVSEPIRVRHARPLLEDRHETEPAGPSTTVRLRNAFNSPFLPFLLSSTSIGQEGLDFHWYCHAIIHWNLPWNPVDFEQRDGRIHRFKNHAVRRNLAHDFGGEALLAGGGGNPWGRLFAQAEKRLAELDKTIGGMRPCWIYEPGDAEVESPGSPKWVSGLNRRGATIERHVPKIPLSQDQDRHDRLQKSLAAYRLVFGQPRQEDLLRYLSQRFPAEQLQEWVGVLAVNLEPPEAPPEERTGISGGSVRKRGEPDLLPS